MIKKEVMEAFSKISEEYGKVRKKSQEVELLCGFKITSFAVDLGCGPGTNLRQILEKSKYVIGLDLSLTMIQKAKRRIEVQPLRWKLDLVVGDLVSLPFREEIFELAIAKAVLHHVPKTEIGKAIEEMRRVVKRAGYIFATFWNISSVKQSKITRRENDLLYVSWKLSDNRVVERPYFNYTIEEIKRLMGEKFGYFSISLSRDISCIAMKL